MKCECGKDSIITAINGLSSIPLCNFHYKIMCIKDIEGSRMMKDVCKECNKGLLLLDGIGSPDEVNIIITFICSNCNKYKLVKKKIEDYFRRTEKK